MSTLPSRNPRFKPPTTMRAHRTVNGVGAMDAATGARGDEPVVYDVPSWWRANDKQRVRYLRKMAEGDGQSPDLRDFVVNRVIRPSGALPMDYRAQAAALLRWTQDNVYYVNEPGEQIQTVPSTIRRGHGDCDDLAVVLAAMAHSIALPFRFCLAGRDRKGNPTRWCEGEKMPRGFRASHVYVQIGTPALSTNPTWYSAEPTIRGLPLGHDVVLHGIPGAAVGQREDLAPGAAVAGLGSVEEMQQTGLTVEDPPSRGALGWLRDNLDWNRVLTGAVEGTITAVAIAYATRGLRRG